ncbi:hypothetical protein Atai01_16280 [Amycolatopsis taiwanensis]|uniref:Uncharacterized protein n=1 Tax=Amycolatopsis taiwanensis TaxID=342230 RepID=A0A9W6QWT3_9PSEU|nr:hypothetical protein Atai01_16280 [Amycolatopsis taiwanensis]
MGLGWLLSGDKTNTAQNDAHNACDIFNGLQLSADSDLATHYRTSAAVVLAEAANAADPRYQQLRDALQGLDQQFNYIGVGNEPAAVNQLNKVVNSVKTACAGA